MIAWARLHATQDMDLAAAPAELSRREREAIEAQRKKDHYMKLHAEGKTEEAQVTASGGVSMTVDAWSRTSSRTASSGLFG